MHHLPANCLPSRVYRTNTKIKMTHTKTTPHPVKIWCSVLMPPLSPLVELNVLFTLAVVVMFTADTEATNSRCRQKGSISILGSMIYKFIYPAGCCKYCSRYATPHHHSRFSYSGTPLSSS
jgi:hypothetical protein